MRRAIMLAMGIVKEAARVVNRMMVIVFLPISQGIFLVAFLCLWFVIVCYVATAGEKTITDTDSFGQLSMPSAAARGTPFRESILERGTPPARGRRRRGEAAGRGRPPARRRREIRSNAASDAGEGPPPAGGEEATGAPPPPRDADRRYHTYDVTDNQQYAIWFLIFDLFWTMEFVEALGQIIVATAAATYYFTRDRSTVGSGTVVFAAKHAVLYHAGTAAFGSFIIGCIKFIKAVLMRGRRVEKRRIPFSDRRFDGPRKSVLDRDASERRPGRWTDASSDEAPSRAPPSRAPTPSRRRGRPRAQVRAAQVRDGHRGAGRRARAAAERRFEDPPALASSSRRRHPRADAARPRGVSVAPPPAQT